jgi:hypothetical protein
LIQYPQEFLEQRHKVIYNFILLRNIELRTRVRVIQYCNKSEELDVMRLKSMRSLGEIIAMPVGKRKGHFKNEISVIARRHLRTVEREIEGDQAVAGQKGWNYNDFVASMLEVIIIMRLRNQNKRNLQDK